MRISELIKELEKFDKNLYVIFTEDGKGRNYSITKEDIQIVNYAYFPYEEDEEELKNAKEYLNIGFF
jgi:hypothetical protein